MSLSGYSIILLLTISSVGGGGGGGGGGVENWFGLDLKHYVVLSPIPLPLLFSQRAKKVVSDSPGLMDFAIRLVNCVLNSMPNGQVKF